MIEIMSQLNGQEKLKLPKNIRQIGLPEEKRKIYVEDYVVTYMNQLASEYSNRQSAAILLGFHAKQEDMQLTFINGAVGIPAAEVEEDQISFRSDLWEDIYSTMRKYFSNSEIVGWFLTRPGKSLGINEKITKIHVDQFPGNNKTLFLMDPLDREEAFFIYENGKLTRQQGYYIYYERNEDMQNYMVENRKGRGSEEVFEAAALNKPVNAPNYTKRKEKPKKKHRGPVLAGTVAAAMALVVVGMALANRLYLPDRLRTVSGGAKEEPLTIEVVEGAIEANNLAEKPLETEDISEIEDNLEDKESSEDEAKPAVNVTATKRYTVRKGDTLVNISLGLYDDRDYVDIICEMNGIEDPDVIYEGMVLELP